MAVKLFLRENTQRKLSIFLEKDQKFLIEEAVRQWGCEDEYIEFSEIVPPIERFYKAAVEQERKFKSRLEKSMGSITSIIASETLMDVSWLEKYQRSMQSLIIPLVDSLTAFNVANDFVRAIDYSILDEFVSIGKMTEPMTKVFEDLSTSINLPLNNALLESTNHAMESFNKLMEEVATIESYIQSPKVVRYYPTIEMYNTSVALGQLADNGEDWNDKIVIPEEGRLAAWLHDIDPSFNSMLEGAEKTIYSDNPDKCRHFASSHRELETHLLHFFAPDNSVLGWTDDPTLIIEGRPTRKARLKYIARNYRNDRFVEFFIDDGIHQMDLLNADQHRKRHFYNEPELLILHKRFLSWLSFLEQITGG